MFLKTFLGAIMRCVISHTACVILSFLIRSVMVGKAYGLEVHGCELEQTPEERRYTHVTSSC